MDLSKIKFTKPLALLLSLVCVVVALLGAFTALRTSFEKIPLVSMVLDDAASSIQDVKDEAEDSIEQYEEVMEEYEEELEEELSKEDLKIADRFVEVLKDTVKTLSIHNITRLADAYGKLGETEFAEIAKVDDQIGKEVEEIKEALSIFNSLYIVALVTVFFTILGGLLGSNALVVLGLILSTLFCYLVAGFLFVILNIVAHVALFIVNRKLKEAKKQAKAANA